MKLKIKLVATLLLDCSHQYKSLMVVIINSLIVTVYPSTPLEPICSVCHSLLFSFIYPAPEIFEQLDGCFRKAVDTYPTDTPGPYSQFLLESRLLYFCFFVSAILVISLLSVVVCFVLSSLYSWIIFFCFSH